jgi:hypothetical protein
MRMRDESDRKRELPVMDVESEKVEDVIETRQLNARIGPFEADGLDASTDEILAKKHEVIET